MKHADFLKSSIEIRKAIVHRSEHSGIPLKWASRELGLDYAVVMRYINAENGMLSEENILSILNFYGVQLRYTLVIDKSRDKYLEEKKFELIKKYDDKNKELTFINRKPDQLPY